MISMNKKSKINFNTSNAKCFRCIALSEGRMSNQWKNWGVSD